MLNFNYSAKIGCSAASVIAATLLSLGAEAGVKAGSSSLNGIVQRDVRGIVQRDIQGIVQRDIQGIVQRDIQGIVQRDIQGIVQRDIQGIVQRDIQGIVQRDLQGIVQRDTQGIVQRDIQGIVHRDIQGIVQRDLQGIVQRDVRGKILSDEQIDSYLNAELVISGRATFVADDAISVMGQIVSSELIRAGAIEDQDVVAIYGQREIDGSIVASQIERLTAPELQDFALINGTVLDIDTDRGIANVSGVEVDYNALLGGANAPALGEEFIYSGRFYNLGQSVLYAE